MDETRPPKVLIVDDVKDNVTLLSLDLEDAGYDVCSAYSGQEALELLACERPDVILLDVMMPEMDGYEACRRIKAQPRLYDIPIILVTARAFDEHVVAGFDAGAHDYVTKPYQSQVLLSRLRSTMF